QRAPRAYAIRRVGDHLAVQRRSHADVSPRERTGVADHRGDGPRGPRTHRAHARRGDLLPHARPGAGARSLTGAVALLDRHAPDPRVEPAARRDTGNLRA